jgi:hypothetical protein
MRNAVWEESARLNGQQGAGRSILISAGARRTTLT